MTKLTEEMYAIFDRDEFAFKKLKEKHSEEEIAQIKAMFIKNCHKINLLKFMSKVGQMVGTYAITIGQLIV